jgi:GxxExxY protein
VNYDGEKIDLGFRIDILVENTVLVEVKAVRCDQSHPHGASDYYLKLSEKYVGLLINFNGVHLRDGIRRLVQAEPPSVPSASCVVKTLVST